MSAGRFMVGDVGSGGGCVLGGVAGRIEQDGVEALLWPPGQDIGGDQLGGQGEAIEGGLQAVQARRRDVDGDDARAGEDKLRGLAAGRRAEIGDALAADVAEQAGGTRRSGVLHPPGAVGIAGQRFDRTGGDQADAAGRQNDAAQTLRPAGRIGFDGEIEGRLDPVRLGDPVGGVIAVGTGPAPVEPIGGVETGIEAGQKLVPLAADAAQHRVGERLEMAGVAVGGDIVDGQRRDRRGRRLP